MYIAEWTDAPITSEEGCKDASYSWQLHILSCCHVRYNHFAVVYMTCSFHARYHSVQEVSQTLSYRILARGVFEAF
jgi:hypothetical protein